MSEYSLDYIKETYAGLSSPTHKSGDAPAVSLLLLLGRTRSTWYDRASCRGSGLDFTDPARPKVDACLQVCGRCEVRTECLDWALDIDDTAAVLGGTDPAARRQIRKQRLNTATEGT
ncbi:WhiB family transcriptional regulator [Ilumatobacter sp.]|uniref:WhiB family transcriptional regulator n=1 Tax=Ilumatobacter sp. TaxID=1967498 RepID=UPI003753CB4C